MFRERFRFDLQRFDDITNSSSNTLVSGTSINDTIWNPSYGDTVTINAGAGNDFIKNYGDYVTISAGIGNDTINNNCTDALTPYDDEDGSYVLFKYSEGDGNDIIYGFKANSTLSITGSSYSSTTSGSNVIFTVGSGKITLVGASSLGSSLNLKFKSKGVTINNTNFDSLISGTSGNDSIYNNAGGDTIDSGAGNDTIITYYHNDNSIKSGAGNDFISLYSAFYYTVDAGDGNDTILSSRPYNGFANSLNGGAGNDLISLKTDYYDEGTTIKGGTGNDTIYGNSGSSITYGLTYQYSSGDGNDIIYNFTSYDKISLGGGTYTRSTVGSNVVLGIGSGSITLNGATSLSTINIVGGTLDSVIRNSTASVSVSGTSGNDTIYNSGNYVTISAGKGNDSIYNAASYAKIDAGAGADTIYNSSGWYYSTINGGAGNDFIRGYFWDSSVAGGAGNDRISMGGDVDRATINPGTGNDTVYMDNYDGRNYYQYTSGDGNDIIYNWNTYDTLKIGNGTGTYSSQVSGSSNVIVTVGEGNITLVGARGLSTINILGTGESPIWRLNGTTATYGTSSNTSISVSNVKSLDGISLSGKVVTIANSSVNKKKIALTGDGYTLNLASGVPAPSTKKAAWSLDGTTATYKSSYKTAGYTLASNSKSITYTKATTATPLATLTGIKATKGLSVSGKVITVAKSAVNATNISINSDEGYTLALANDVSAPATKKAAWSLNGTTATYKGTYKTAGYTLAKNSKSITYTKATTAKTLATLTGIKATKGLSVSGKVITVAKSAVNATNIAITDGEGYTLALANDVSAPSTKKEAWSLNGTTATYKGTYKTEGYTLAKNSKSITYTAATTPKTLATLTGIKATKGLSVSGKVITVAKSAVNAEKISLTGSGYTLKLADGLAPETKKAVWSIKDSTATYKSSYKTAGYTLAKNSKSVTYSKATTANTLATIKGAASTNGLSVSGSKITLKDTALSSKVTIGGSYDFNFASGYKTATITGSSNADTITTNGTKLSVSGGTGNDSIKVLGSTTTIMGGAGNDSIFSNSKGKNVFVYNSGDGKDVITDFAANDTIKIVDATAKVTTSGSDVVFTVGKGAITLKNAADKNISYSDKGGKKTYSAPKPTEQYSISPDGTVAILFSTFSAKTFYSTDSSIDKDEDLITIDASAVTKALDIMGNDNSNLIIGGKKADTIDGGAGDDTLTGGAGADIFLYFNGDGDDVINDYAASDKIKITGNSVEPENSGRDVVLKVGEGKITVKNAVRNNIDVTYIENGIECGYIGGEKTVDIKGTTVTINENYLKDTFDASKATGIKEIDARNVNRDGLTIIGNSGRNEIFANAYDCTLNGGKGNDTLWGGDGKNIYLYAEGDGFDSIVTYGKNDVISITSGRVEDSQVGKNSDTVILTIGEGKISLGGAANGNAIIYYDADGRHSETFRPKTTGNLFASEDDIFLDDSNAQLDWLINETKDDYSSGDFEDSTSLTKENNPIAFCGRNDL